MVLDYLGLPAPYEQLLKLLDVQWYGTPSFNIRAIEQLGVDVIYRQGTLAELRDHLSRNCPAIVFVVTDELPYTTRRTDHAVVVVGMDRDYVYLNDPAAVTVPVPVPLGDFELAWLERDEYYAVLMRRG